MSKKKYFVLTANIYNLFLYYSHSIEELKGKRIILFSYGSGLASAMFSLHFTEDECLKNSLLQLKDNVSHVNSYLEHRAKCSPEMFAKMMKLREDTHNSGKYQMLFNMTNN